MAVPQVLVDEGVGQRASAQWAASKSISEVANSQPRQPPTSIELERLVRVHHIHVLRIIPGKRSSSVADDLTID